MSRCSRPTTVACSGTSAPFGVSGGQGSPRVTRRTVCDKHTTRLCISKVGDTGWGRPHAVVQEAVAGVVLGATERAWLAACGRRPRWLDGPILRTDALIDPEDGAALAGAAAIHPRTIRASRANRRRTVDPGARGGSACGKGRLQSAGNDRGR